MGYLKCYDISGYDIDYIYQWDINRKVIIKGIDFDENMMIHICHVDSVEALKIEPTLSGNDIIVSIPNILLQRAAPVVLYFVRDSGNASSYTTQSLRITVAPRAKPSDYVYTETEVLTWKSLDERLNKVERNMSGIDEEDVANAVEDYLTKHPVTVTETDPTVPEWAKQKNKPSYTAQEVGALSAEALPAAVNEALAQAKASGAFDGADGKDGQDGYTPVNGVDYFTPAEVEEIAEQAAEMVEVPTDEHIKNLINTALGVIENGTY